ncbi:MAG: pyrroline-5-carboxylate reductase [Lachnospiraceae bacterium]|nr:pyrroline-5-carboxylate reductase [Lachnospiraceae bacterium]
MRIGFIGCGNMATAMISGILESGAAKEEEIMASDKAPLAQKKIIEELKIQYGETNQAVAEFADVLFLAVKPQYYADVISEIKYVMTGKEVIVTIAPGKTLGWLEQQFGRPLKIVRTMPNTPAMVKAGMMGLSKNQYVTDGEMEMVQGLCRSFGRAEWVPENLLDVVTSVSGSGPAYVFMMIEAMADGAVADGMPRALAYEFAAQAVYGSAKMILDLGKHPGELKDMVCSPGGTTIDAVRVLEERGFRSALIEAEKACVKKAKKL